MAMNDGKAEFDAMMLRLSVEAYGTLTHDAAPGACENGPTAQWAEFERTPEGRRRANRVVSLPVRDTEPVEVTVQQASAANA